MSTLIYPTPHILAIAISTDCYGVLPFSIKLHCITHKIVNHNYQLTKENIVVSVFNLIFRQTNNHCDRTDSSVMLHSRNKPPTPLPRKNNSTTKILYLVFYIIIIQLNAVNMDK